tara:strand:+ start:3827 stop:4585 length:759 start_codon:yes stop_codon:yes gene_type:complete
VVPTEFVELPSQGKYYPEGHPLCGEESIEIRQMTAREEDMLTSRTLLKKGIALDRVIQSLIVDNRVDADALLIGDRNAIIVAMRVSGYGSAYETSVSCPACGETQQYSFNLNEGVVYDGADSKTLDVTNNNDGTFEVTLPRTKVSVRFKLLTGTDEKALVKAMEVSRKKKSPEHVVTNQMANMIVAVNGDTSHQALDYFINNAPSIDARHLRLAYRLTAPNIDLTQSFECKECDHERPMEVPLTADFFWPDR